MYVCMYVCRERERERERERDRIFVRGKRSLFFERGEKIVPTFFSLSELGPFKSEYGSPPEGETLKKMVSIEKLHQSPLKPRSTT